MSVDLAKLRTLADTARAKTQTIAKRDSRSWFSVTNLADRAEVYIYDAIGEWGVTANDFTAELRAITAPAVDLHISSPGGAVFDGLTIFEAIRQHPARVTAYVDGLAASAASFIVQAADRRVMARNGVLLVHDAEGAIVGTAADFAEYGALLEEMSANVAAIYEERAGGTAAEWRARMRAGGQNLGTRYVGREAVTAGLADEVAEHGPSNTADVQPFMGAGRQPDTTGPAAAAGPSATADVEAFDVEAFARAMREALQ
jgi:ATP-dependent protease ClpP protease subunit